MHFGACFHLIILYIIGYNDIWRPLHDSHPKIWGVATPNHSKIDAYGLRGMDSPGLMTLFYHIHWQSAYVAF